MTFVLGLSIVVSNLNNADRIGPGVGTVQSSVMYASMAVVYFVLSGHLHNNLGKPLAIVSGMALATSGIAFGLLAGLKSGFVL